MTLFDETYDYIVIGSGSAGSVVASRLSETSTSRVLVIEAGGRDWMPLYKVPLMAGTLFRYKYNNWWYQTLPEPNAQDVELGTITLGKVAVVKYSGFNPMRKRNAKFKKLMNWIEKNGLEVYDDNFYSAGYDSPWTLPWKRTNEVMILLK